MKQNNLTKSLFVALLVASPMAGAGTPYPAPFEPVIIYQDADLIAKHAARPSQAAVAPVASAQSSKSVATSSAESSSVAEVAPAASPSSAQGGGVLAENAWLGGVVLALVGFIVWSSKKSGASKQATASFSAEPVVAAAAASGETGVARYLNTLSGAEVVKTAETGVAKYLKSLPVAEVVTVAETGVAKYLKNLA